MNMFVYPAFYLWFFLTLAEWVGGAILMYRVTQGRRGHDVIGSGLVLILLGLAALALWAGMSLLPDGLDPRVQSSPFPWFVSGVPLVLGMIALFDRRTCPSK